MQGQRKVDHDTVTHYPCERVTAVNGQFYFSTREGGLEGPFASREDAEREICCYIRKLNQGADLIDDRSH
jgi:hypothetical protein